MRKLLQQQLISGPRLKIKFQESLQISDERKKKTSILFTWDAIANTHTHPCMHKHTRTCATTYLTPTHAQTHPLTHPLSHAHVQKEKNIFPLFHKKHFLSQLGAGKNSNLSLFLLKCGILPLFRVFTWLNELNDKTSSYLIIRNENKIE